MSIDISFVTSLNLWGERNRSLVRIWSNDFVYVVVLLSILWFCLKIFKSHSQNRDWKVLVRDFLFKGTLIFAIPVGIATAISEVISTIYVRQRPFVALPKVQLLVPHGIDGGMPSHHIVFMVTLIFTVYFYDKKAAIFLALLTLLSGIARVAAGIHYPSDIVVGAVIGMTVAYFYHVALLKLMGRARLNLD
jgi:membrane-associated phospholipid phosphatase